MIEVDFYKCTCHSFFFLIFVHMGSGKKKKCMFLATLPKLFFVPTLNNLWPL